MCTEISLRKALLLIAPLPNKCLVEVKGLIKPDIFNILQVVLRIPFIIKWKVLSSYSKALFFKLFLRTIECILECIWFAFGLLRASLYKTQ